MERQVVVGHLQVWEDLHQACNPEEEDLHQVWARQAVHHQEATEDLHQVCKAVHHQAIQLTEALHQAKADLQEADHKAHQLAWAVLHNKALETCLETHQIL